MMQGRIAYQRLALAGLVSLGLAAAACGGEASKPASQTISKQAARSAGQSYAKPAVGSAIGGSGAVGTGCATTSAC